MSSGASGEGSGASLQEKETDILRRDDAETIAETLAEVSRMVIEWHFGNGVAPLARVELVVPVAEDATQVVTAATLLADRGAKVSASALMDKLNLPVATDAADALLPAIKTQDARPEVIRQDTPQDLEILANAMDNQALGEWLFEIRSALAKDMQPLGAALAGAMEAGDLPAMQAALRKISKGMPELAGDAANLAEVLAGQFTSAFLGDCAEEVENGDLPGHPFRGNQWGNRPKAQASRSGPAPWVKFPRSWMWLTRTRTTAILRTSKSSA